LHRLIVILPYDNRISISRFLFTDEDMKGFMNRLAGALRWMITLMFAAGLLMLPANNASA
jgi:hypothetical protein